MPIDCNKHCKDEQEVICRLQQQLVKLESQYEEAVQTPQQTQQQIQQKSCWIRRLTDSRTKYTMQRLTIKLV